MVDLNHGCVNLVPCNTYLATAVIGRGVSKGVMDDPKIFRVMVYHVILIGDCRVGQWPPGKRFNDNLNKIRCLERLPHVA